MEPYLAKFKQNNHFVLCISTRTLLDGSDGFSNYFFPNLRWSCAQHGFVRPQILFARINHSSNLLKFPAFRNSKNMLLEVNIIVLKSIVWCRDRKGSNYMSSHVVKAIYHLLLLN